MYTASQKVNAIFLTDFSPENKGRHGVMEDVDGSSLPADSQPKLVDLVSWSVGWQPSGAESAFIEYSRSMSERRVCPNTAL